MSRWCGPFGRCVIWLAALLALGVLVPVSVRAQEGYAKLKLEAEKLVAEGSYALAHQTYTKANALNLDETDRRWVQFRLAETIRSALKIAQTDADKACLQYLLARTLSQNGTQEEMALAQDAFEAVFQSGKASEWYDDALYHYGEWLTNSGRVIRDRRGS